VASDREVAPVVGGAPAFRAFVRDELMPEIDRRYRTDGTTAVLGESLAGLWIVDTFFETPDLFGAYLALDPSLWWDGQRRVREAPAWLAAHPDVTARLYLTYADEPTIGPHVEALVGALRARTPPGLVWTDVPRPDLTHATIYRATKRDALRWWITGTAGGPR
jgi:predicted alpha/beta superfamily hydrolase